MRTLDHTRVTIAAQAVGIAQGALDYALGYVRERKQFGKAIAEFQGLQFMLADMGMKLEAARQLTYAAAAKSERGDADLTYFGAAAKCFASDVAMEITTDAVQLLGGYGYTRDYPVERMMRDAKITQIYEGTNQVQRIVMARQTARALGRRRAGAGASLVARAGAVVGAPQQLPDHGLRTRARVDDGEPMQVPVDRVGEDDVGFAGIDLMARHVDEHVGAGGDVQPEGVGSVQSRGLIVGVVLRHHGRERLGPADDAVGRVVEEQIAPTDLRRSVARRRAKRQDVAEGLDVRGDLVDRHLCRHLRRHL